MGREIRRVPADWQHPRGEDGDYQPMYDKAYDDAAKSWVGALIDWENGGEQRQRAEASEYNTRWFWDWEDGPPNPACYRKKTWTDDEATHYQVYETVTEGTPVSPVFASLEELEDWLVSEGHSRHAAKRFCEQGSVPSMYICPASDGRMTIRMGIDMLDVDVP